MTNEYLSKRYGKTAAKARKQRVFWTSVGTMLVVAFFIWSISINFASPAKISGAMQNFTVVDALQTKVTVKISNPTAQDGRCSINVLNKGFSVVGYKELAVAGSLGKAPSIDALINTTSLGVSATVDRCWFK